MLYEDFLQSLHAALDLFLCMGSHKCETHEGILRSACWRYYRIDEYSGIVSEFCYEERLIDVTNVEWYDRTFCLANLETFFAEAAQSILGNLPQALYALWLTTNDVESLHSCCCCGWCV